MKKKWFVPVALLMILLLAFPILSGNVHAEEEQSDSGIAAEASVAPTAVSLQSSAWMSPGTCMYIPYTLKPSNATTTLTWTSSDTSVATVDADGKVWAHKDGLVNIGVKTANGLKSNCVLSVKAIPVTSIVFPTTSYTLKVGETVTPTRYAYPKDSYSEFTWKSSNTSVATVTNKGVVTAVGAGTATITTTATNGNVSGSCTVTVTDPSTANLVPVYRLYSPITGEHLYTKDKNEYDTLWKSYGWGQEGIAWYAPKSGTAVYRLYQPTLKNHLYTTDKNEVNTLCSKYGWKKDNNGQPVYYSGGSVSIYRVYNAGLNGMHHLTTDTAEYNKLPSYGWKKEGAKLSAAKVGSPFSKTSYYK